MAGRNWMYDAASDPWTDSGIALPVDQWVHVRIELYTADQTTWMWATTGDGHTKVIAAGIPWKGRVSGTSIRYDGDVRVLLGAGATDGSSTYIDNFKAQLIDPTSQGYPVVHPVSQPIVVNGVVDVNTEWAGVKKVAYKPVGSKGNFNAVSPAAYIQGLADNTKIDAYVGYDKNFFYVAMVGNNMTSGLADIYANGRVEAVFTYDYNEVTPTVNYSFFAYAAGANQTVNADSIGYYRTTGHSGPSSPMTYSAFTAAGGQIAYKVSGSTMTTEMKIPFTIMSEFTGIQAGKKLNVQFNYVEQNIGDHRAATSLVGDFYPGVGYGVRVADALVGVTFPVAGDFDGNCKVDFVDLKAFADNWLLDNKTTDIKGTDGKTNFLDYSVFSANWMYTGQCE